MTKNNRLLSVLIVNYNVTALLRGCLRSLFEKVEGVEFEILVADNASPDVSWKDLKTEFPEVQFFGLEDNLGFSRANNLLASKATGKYVLLLNPDTLLMDSKLQELLTFAESIPNFGIAGVRLIDAEGKFHPEAKRGIPDARSSFSKLFLSNKAGQGGRGYYRDDVEETAVTEVEVVTGAFLLIKKTVFEELGGLDPAYFMYGEDIDLCVTSLNAGYSNWYFGPMTVLHYKGESTLKNAAYLKRFYGAMGIFLDKYYKKTRPLEWSVLKLGLWVKYQIERTKL